MRKIYSLVLIAAALLVGTNVWANVAHITFSDERAAVDCADLAALQTAIAALPTDGTVATIQLLDNIDGGELAADQSVLSLPANTKSILDLNGHTLSAQLKLTVYAQRLTIHVINNFGELTVNDGVGNGKIMNSYLDANKNNSNYDCISVIRNNAGATLNLNKCIVNNGAMGIDNHGTMTINSDVTIEVAEGSKSTLVNSQYGYSNGGAAISARNGSHTTINGGFIKSHAFNAIEVNSSAIVDISGGDFYGVSGFGWVQPLMEYKSQLTISGGSFDADPAEYVDQTHYADLEENRYVIKNIPSGSSYTVSTLTDLQDKLNLATNVQPVFVTLGADIVVSGIVTLQHGSQLTIPAGRILTVQDGGLFVNEGKTVNAGTIATIDNGFFSKPASVIGSGTFNISNLSISVAEDVVTYVISNGMQLQYLAYLASLNEYTDKTWNISLTNDINLPTAANFERIGTIIGNFEGNNHSINNLTIVSASSQGALIKTFGGTFQNVTLNNIDIRVGSTASALFNGMKPNSVVKNVKLNGLVTSQTGSVSAFAGSMYGSGMTAEDHLWFVNCESNVNISTGGSFAGVFCTTISGTKGTIGFYNCKNNGNVSANYAGVLMGYGYGASLDVIAITNTGTITGSKNGSNWKVSGVNYVGIDSRAHSTNYLDPATYVAVWDETNSKYVPREIGDIVQPVNPTTTDWATNTTWAEETQTGDPIVPTASDEVEMTSNVQINNGTDAEAKQVIIYNNATLTVKKGGTLTIGDGGLDLTGGNIVIEPGAEVRINGEVVGNNAENIVISSDETGTSVFAVNPANPMVGVEAKIQLYTTARHQGDTYYYNYIGIPTSTAINSSTLTRTAVSGNTEDLTMYLYGWNVQTGWQQGGWELLSQPFRGVALTSESTAGTIFTFKGTLVGNEDGQMNFNHMGFNFFANSYTAPINISTLLAGFSDDVRATIYIYDQSRNRISGVSKADFSGYFTPAFTVIPSMQAFFVFTEEQTAVTEEIDYLDAVWNNTASNAPLNAPTRLMDNGLFKRAIINVTSQNGASDQVNLVGEDRFSADFDNGYDAVKFMNSGLNIYAKTATHSLQNIFTDNLEGTFIGFAANETDNMYTLSFEGVAGEPMAIKDLMTGIITVMTEGNTYTFTQAEESTIDNRFQIVGINQMPTAIDNVEGGAVSADGIYSITGQYVGTVDMWNEMPSGIYIVNGVKLVK